MSLNTQHTDSKDERARPDKFNPIITNPMLNALFNNPAINSNSGMKRIVDLLVSSPSSYILLVPETRFLLLSTDQDSKKRYTDLCNDPQFIQSHLIDIDLQNYTESERRDARQSKHYRTLNGHCVSIHKQTIKNVSGYRHNFVIRILRQHFFRSFCTYIPFGACFHIMFVNEALIGNPSCEGIAKITPKQRIVDNFSNNDDSTTSLLSQDVFDSNSISFTDILHRLPQVADVVGVQFKDLFKSFNAKDANSDADLEELFTTIMARGSTIINELPDKQLKAIYAAYPTIDLREVICAYIETNIFDHFWAQYKKCHKNDADDMLNKAYTDLKCLSINQCGTPERLLQRPKELASIEKRVNSAIDKFSRLQFASSTSQQCEILFQTFDILTDNHTSETIITVDADTLISLLIMVIAHSGVQDLNNRLQYLKRYCYSEEILKAGPGGYAISSIEAVCNYYASKDNIFLLKKYSADNDRLWSLIRSIPSNTDGTCEQALRKLQAVFDSYEDGLDIPMESCIRSRTLDGQSCLMLSLIQKNSKLFNQIFDYQNIYTLDDILEDRTISGTTLLTAALELEHPALDSLASVILQATKEEIETYCNQPDEKGRRMGHILFHGYRLICSYGRYIDWQAKDLGGRTSLFTILRCYDHPKYFEMIKSALEAAKSWYASKGLQFSIKDHIDKKGNTLIHIIKEGNGLHLLLSLFDGLDVNIVNSNRLTPLMQYIKYSRLSNVKEILACPGLQLLKSEGRYYLTAEDYVKVEKAQNLEDGNELTNYRIMNLVDDEFDRRYAYEMNGYSGCAVRARFDTNNNMCFYFRCYDRIEDLRKPKFYPPVVHSYESFVKLFKLLKILLPETYISDSPSWLSGYSNISGKVSIYSSRKFRINRLLLNTNLLLGCFLFNSSTRKMSVIKEYLSVQAPLNEVSVIKEHRKEQIEVRQNILDSRNSKKYILRPEEIGNFSTFLKFSRAQLGDIAKGWDQFYRILCFTRYKWLDLSYSLESIAYLTANTFKSDAISKSLFCLPYKMLQDLGKERQNVTSLVNPDVDDIFLDTVKLLKLSTVELINRINQLLKVKIAKWWKLYAEAKEIQTDLLTILKLERGKNINERTPIGNVVDQALLDIGILIGSINEQSIKSLKSKMQFSNGMEGLFQGNGGYFSNVVEKRRKDDATKLVGRSRKLKNEMVTLNIELKMQYESLCIELNNFYEFKQYLIKASFRKFAKARIESLKMQYHEMHNSLDRLKSNDKNKHD